MLDIILHAECSGKDNKVPALIELNERMVKVNIVGLYRLSLIALLRYNLHTIQFIHLKYTIY